MRLTMALSIAVLALAAPSGALAQGAVDSTVRAVDKAGETAQTKGAAGTVVPASPGVAVAPGVQAPFETPVPPANAGRDGPPARK